MVVMLCVASFPSCRTQTFRGRFPLFENQVALNSDSYFICIHSTSMYDDMVVPELAEPVRHDWEVPEGKLPLRVPRPLVGGGGARCGLSANGVGARKTQG